MSRRPQVGVATSEYVLLLIAVVAAVFAPIFPAPRPHSGFVSAAALLMDAFGIYFDSFWFMLSTPVP